MQKPFSETFGLDISNNAITAVELGLSGKQLKIINFARVELTPGIVDDNWVIVDREGFKEALNRLLLEGYSGPFMSKNVIISIPEDKTFSHRLCLPFGSTDDEDFILEEAGDFIPVDLDRAVTDFRLLDACRNSNKDVNVDFVATQKNIVDSVIGILAEAGLKVIFVDVDKNSLIRACDNGFMKQDDDYMIVDAGDNKTSLSISGKGGLNYSISSEVSGDEFIKKVREGLKIETDSEARSLFAGLASDPDARDKEGYNKIEGILKEDYGKLTSRMSELMGIAENQDSINVKRIYLLGSYSRSPGMADFIKEFFPGTEIALNLGYIQLDENTELHYCKAIGMALRAILPLPEAKEINLLPKNEKDEVINKMLIPVISKFLLTASSVLAVIAVFSGVVAARSYLEYRTSEKEVRISAEKYENPYLHQVAKASQQRTQLEIQINTILRDAIPVSPLIKKLDNINRQGIDLINASFKLTGKTNEIRVRARTASREYTENLLGELEGEEYFSKIISPLSNLSGKGERFINIDLVADTDRIINEYNLKNTAVSDSADDEATEAKPKKPAIKAAETPSSATDPEDGIAEDTPPDAENTLQLDDGVDEDAENGSQETGQ